MKPKLRDVLTFKVLALLLAMPLLLGLESLPAQAPVPSPLGNWNLTDPVASTDPTNQFAAGLTLVSSGANCAPVFSNAGGISFTHAVTNGWNQSDQQAKLTFQSFGITMQAHGQGQRIPFGLTLNSSGMGDALAQVITVVQDGGVNASGDEGTSALSVQVHQSGGLSRGKIQKVFQAAINTTLTNAVTNDVGTQIAQVGSTAGLAVGQWVLANPATYDVADQEAVQVTAMTATSISAKFCRSHPAGTAIVGAVVVNLQIGAGQGRLLVNLTQPSYATGTAGTSNNAFSGVGTNWQTAGLAGATPTNLGAISFAADDVTDPPFGGGASRLRDWYPIVSFTDDAHGHFLTRKQVGHQYQGIAGAPGPYEIRPSAIVMAISPTDNPEAGKLVLSACPLSWFAVGDLCECAKSPDADVTPLIVRAGTFSRGGNYPAMALLRNDGRRDFYSGMSIGGDGAGFGFGLNLSACQTGIKIVNPAKSAIELIGDNTAIHWAPSKGDFSIRYDKATNSLVICGPGGVVALRIDNQGGLHGNMQP